MDDFGINPKDMLNQINDTMAQNLKPVSGAQGITAAQRRTNEGLMQTAAGIGSSVMNANVNKEIARMNAENDLNKITLTHGLGLKGDMAKMKYAKDLLPKMPGWMEDYIKKQMRDGGTGANQITSWGSGDVSGGGFPYFLNNNPWNMYNA